MCVGRGRGQSFHWAEFARCARQMTQSSARYTRLQCRAVHWVGRAVLAHPQQPRPSPSPLGPPPLGAAPTRGPLVCSVGAWRCGPKSRYLCGQSPGSERPAIGRQGLITGQQGTPGVVYARGGVRQGCTPGVYPRGGGFKSAADDIPETNPSPPRLNPRLRLRLALPALKGKCSDGRPRHRAGHRCPPRPCHPAGLHTPPHPTPPGSFPGGRPTGAAQGLSGTAGQFLTSSWKRTAAHSLPWTRAAGDLAAPRRVTLHGREQLRRSHLMRMDLTTDHGVTSLHSTPLLLATGRPWRGLHNQNAQPSRAGRFPISN